MEGAATNTRHPPLDALRVSFRLSAVLAAADARRMSSWLALVGPIMGILALHQLPEAMQGVMGWANGAVAGVIAIGVLPGFSGMPIGLVAGRRDRRIASAWFVERVAWPLLGAALGWSATAAASNAGLALAVCGGIFASSLLIASCRCVGCSAEDAASGTLGIAVAATAVTFAVQPPLSAEASSIVSIGWLVALWSVLAGVFLYAASQVDRRVWIARDLANGGVSLGHSEIRRWMIRLMMAGTLLGMVRWLFATELSVNHYGMVGVLLVASLVLPEALLLPAAASWSWARTAWVEGGQLPRWRLGQAWFLPAVVVGWPLLIAVVLVPAARSVEAALVAAAILGVVIVAFVANLAVLTGWIAGETVFAIVLLVAWHAAAASLESSVKRSLSSHERFQGEFFVRGGPPANVGQRG